MIYLYGVECPGCSSKILLRVGVALDDVQPFFYVCERCRVPTKVRQVIRYEPHPHAWIELEGGQQIEARGLAPDQTITINPELPTKPGAKELGDDGGSAGLMHFAWLGERFAELMERTRTFREVTNKDWVNFKRLGEFYVNRDWARFDAEGRRIMEERWPTLTSDVQRHDAFNRLLQTVFMPFVVTRELTDIVSEYARFMNSHTKNNARLRDYCRDQLDAGLISTLQRDVLRRCDYVVQNRSAFLSALPLEFYPPSRDAEIEQLRLFRDEFDILKLHYVDTYELAHKVLTPVMGFVNCLERGDPDSFDPAVMALLASQNKKNFGKLKSLADFAKQPNAPKVAFLENLPVLKGAWETVLRPDLRNAMGHHDARHDLRTGLIQIDGSDEVSYIRVAATNARTVPVLLVLAHLLKTFAVVEAILRPNYASGSPASGPSATENSDCTARAS